MANEDTKGPIDVDVLSAGVVVHDRRASSIPVHQPEEPQQERRVETPADLMVIAANAADPDLDRLERLMAMQIAWEEREAEKAFTRAFAAFKAEVPVLPRNKHVQFLQTDYWYTEHWLADKICKPLLSKHGLSVTWEPIFDEKGTPGVESTLQHVDGYKKTIRDFAPPDEQKGSMRANQRMQSTRSSLARRNYFALLGLASGLPDTDGNFDEDHPEDPAPPSNAPPEPTAEERAERAVAAFAEIDVSRDDLERHLGAGMAEWSADDFRKLTTLLRELRAQKRRDPDGYHEHLAKRLESEGGGDVD
jgi:hypothetical protein